MIKVADMPIEEAMQRAAEIATGKFVDPEISSRIRGIAMVALRWEVLRLRDIINIAEKDAA